MVRGMLKPIGGGGIENQRPESPKSRRSSRSMRVHVLSKPNKTTTNTPSLHISYYKRQLNQSLMDNQNARASVQDPVVAFTFNAKSNSSDTP